MLCQRHTKQIEGIKERPRTINSLVGRTKLPFMAEVMAEILLPKLKMPQMETIDSTKDQMEHLEMYEAYMHLYAVPDEIMCRTFPTILEGSARIWFEKLKVGFIGTFTQLSKIFVGHFTRGQRHKEPATYRMNAN